MLLRDFSLIIASGVWESLRLPAGKCMLQARFLQDSGLSETHRDEVLHHTFIEFSQVNQDEIIHGVVNKVHIAHQIHGLVCDLVDVC